MSRSHFNDHSFLRVLQSGWQRFADAKSFVYPTIALLLSINILVEIYLGWRAQSILDGIMANSMKTEEFISALAQNGGWEWFILRFAQFFLVMGVLIRWFFHLSQKSCPPTEWIIFTFKAMVGCLFLMLMMTLGMALPLVIFVAGLFAPIIFELCFSNGRLVKAVKNCMRVRYGSVELSSRSEGFQRGLLVLSVWATGYIVFHWLSMGLGSLFGSFPKLEAPILSVHPMSWDYLLHSTVVWGVGVWILLFVHACFYHYINGLIDNSKVQVITSSDLK